MERFLDYFIPSHYELEECISRQTEQLKGRVCIVGKLLSADVIKIHAVDLEIINVGWTQYQSEHQADFGKYNFEACFILSATSISSTCPSYAKILSKE